MEKARALACDVVILDLEDAVAPDAKDEARAGAVAAAKAGGFHYRYDASQGAWLDTKGAGEFFANLSRYATEQSGLVLQFSAR